MALNNVISFNISEAKRFLVGLVGHGPALDALVLMMGKSGFAAAFPQTRIAGWVPKPEGLGPEDEIDILPELKRQQIFPDIPALFAAKPGIALVIDLSPDSRHMEELRACAPAGVSIGSADLLLRFCAATEDGRLTVSGGESLRKEEKLFALLVDQMDGDILILDNEGRIIDANRHAALSRDMTIAELIGKSCADLDKDKRFCCDDEARCPFHAAQKNCRQEQHTFAHTLDTGRVRYIHAVCFPVTDAFGGPTQYLYIRRDVTEQQQLEQRLQQTEKMAAIGELSTYMAHEIRNPLFAIGGFANALLRNPSLNDLAREKARIIYDESRRLDVILSSILNFARPTEQTLHAFDAGAVARQTMDLMGIGSEERHINMVMDIEDNLPMVSGNPENLKQCLINLVKNGMEAMPEGGVLNLSAGRDGEYVQISVADTGEGIPVHLHDKVFSPFFTTKHGGAGLGLAMTRKVIEDMGGRVDLDSRRERGTRVILRLPVALAVEEQNDADLPRNGAAVNGDSGVGRRDMSAAARKSPDEDPYA